MSESNAALVSFETSVTVNAPIQAVYDYVADFPRHVEWNHQPQEMKSLTPGPVAVGSQYETVEEMPENMSMIQKIMFGVMMPVIKWRTGTNGNTIAEITALESPNRVAWKAHMPSKKKGDLMRMNWELRLAEQGGSTEVTQRCEVIPPPESPFAKMAANQDMADMSKAGVQANLQRMKAIVEKRTSAG